MDINVIATLTELVKASGLTALEVEENGVKIRLENGGLSLSSTAVAASAVPATPAVAASVPAVSVVPAAEVAAVAPVAADDGKFVKSTIVGSFVSLEKAGRKGLNAGDKVAAGDVVCIVEAMKTMFDVTSDIDGEFVELCCADGDMVESGQNLVKLR